MPEMGQGRASFNRRRGYGLGNTYSAEQRASFQAGMNYAKARGGAITQLRKNRVQGSDGRWYVEE